MNRPTFPPVLSGTIVIKDVINRGRSTMYNNLYDMTCKLWFPKKICCSLVLWFGPNISGKQCFRFWTSLLLMETFQKQVVEAERGPFHVDGKGLWVPSKTFPTSKGANKNSWLKTFSRISTILEELCHPKGVLWMKRVLNVNLSLTKKKQLLRNPFIKKEKTMFLGRTSALQVEPFWNPYV